MTPNQLSRLIAANESRHQKADVAGRKSHMFVMAQKGSCRIAAPTRSVPARGCGRYLPCGKTIIVATLPSLAMS